VWFGLIFLLVLANGVRLRPLGRRKGGWLQTTAFGTGVALLLVLSVLNPDRMIADRNIDRYEATGRIDVDYLESLSPDAAPAIARLPEPMRACALRAIARQFWDDEDTWYEYNRSRRAALDLAQNTRAVC
jgi:hypothetical protein